MPATVIQVENLGKSYWIGRRGENTDMLREALCNGVSRLGRSLWNLAAGRGQPKSDRAEFWALRDVSFEVKQGEVVGIIGRNGAGKSTLLKILSRITEPTTGRIRLRGRVGSLLEVGTGFHPELTGRENVYLNGAILGMSRHEIDRRFDAIVDFSGIETFLDTPVKRYSSGMYARLAFAVAAHLEPELLIIDEVLSVGDLAFQKKCLGKMQQVAHGGRTVLFVSHNMQAVQHLCTRGLLLHRGRLVAAGSVSSILRTYQRTITDADFTATTAHHDEKLRRGNGAARFHSVSIHDKHGTERLDYQMGDTIRFTLRYRVFRPIDELYVVVMLRSGATGAPVTSARHLVSPTPLPGGHDGCLTIEWPAANLRPGEYGVYLWLGDRCAQAYDVVDGLFGPLQVFADGSIDQLGFDPSRSCGYFNIESHLHVNSPADHLALPSR